MKEYSKNIKFIIPSIDIEIDLMAEDGKSANEMLSWFTTPCDNEEGYNAYLAEDIPAGLYTIDELISVVNDRICAYFDC